MSLQSLTIVSSLNAFILVVVPVGRTLGLGLGVFTMCLVVAEGLVVISAVGSICGVVVVEMVTAAVEVGVTLVVVVAVVDRNGD